MKFKYFSALILTAFAIVSCENHVSEPESLPASTDVIQPEDLSVNTNDIINGAKAADGELRSTVMLYTYSGAYCTGTLITPTWVLTAAHCVEACDDDNGVIYYLPYMHIGIGNSENKIEYSYDYDRLIPHPNFRCSSVEIRNDIALIHLKQSVPSSVAIPTPPMPDISGIVLTAEEVDQAYNYNSSTSTLNMTTAGFGLTNPYNYYSSGTKYKTSPAPFALCRLTGKQGKYCGSYAYATSTRGFIYFDPENTGTCQGDSGGPTFFTRGNIEYVIGVTSWGLDDCAGVDASTFVPDYYNDFIAKHVDNLPSTTPENCSNGIDDNDDGLIDCQDPLCLGRPICLPEDCTNGKDDNGDRLVDCQDPKCKFTDYCKPEDCNNGIDDNLNGLIDCEDPQCSSIKRCIPEDCSNGIDDNDNGLIDCQDPQCANVLRCQPENCSNGIDDNGDGLIDCRDPQCSDHKRCQPEICNNFIDDNENGLIDCDDYQCMGTIYCQPEICDNGIDDNQNTLLDCADPTCSDNPVCLKEICDNGIDDNKDGLTDCDDPACNCGGADSCASTPRSRAKYFVWPLLLLGAIPLLRRRRSVHH